MRSRFQTLPAALLAAAVLLACLTFAQAQKNQGWQNRTLTGHVLNRQEQPLPKAIVYLKNTKTLAIKTYISDPDGSYHFPALSPNVDYEVYAEFQGTHSDTKTLSAFDTRKLINITLHVK
ncbi:MAG TPA: carboxypeptidase-like regulatory domain-containing protein [Candidatus Angelobacter sp.]|nr:carboxypeptidase-like regulatory domain-containing protein [Candidatus Angelobacter sp.]